MSNTIHPQELRINNYIEFQETSQYVKVTEIMNDGFSVIFPDDEHTWIEADQFGPIPLTEEILVKCGLYKVNHIHGYSFWTMDRRNGVNKWKPAISIYERYTEYCGHIIKPVTCLHELQNTFYYTSGRELEIKL